MVVSIASDNFGGYIFVHEVLGFVSKFVICLFKWSLCVVSRYKFLLKLVHLPGWLFDPVGMQVDVKNWYFMVRYLWYKSFLLTKVG